MLHPTIMYKNLFNLYSVKMSFVLFGTVSHTVQSVQCCDATFILDDIIVYILIHLLVHLNNPLHHHTQHIQHLTHLPVNLNTEDIDIVEEKVPSNEEVTENSNPDADMDKKGQDYGVRCYYRKDRR